MKKSEELKEYVCWLSPTAPLNLSRYNKARSQTVWAKDPADAVAKLAYLESSGFVVKCLYTMDAFDGKMKALKEKESKHLEKASAKPVEAENV